MKRGWRLVRGYRSMQIRTGAERVSVSLVGCSSDEEADRRAAIISAIARRLVRAGRGVAVKEVCGPLGLAFEADVPTLAERLEHRALSERTRSAVARRARVARQVAEIYFVADAHGYIKIGRAVDVQARVAVLQNAHAEPLTLLATTPGGAVKERRLHAQFATSRVRGEWFARTPELLAAIEAVASHTRLHGVTVVNSVSKRAPKVAA